MATQNELNSSLLAFKEGYDKNQKLRIMNRDWNRVILIEAKDLDSKHAIKLINGEITVSEGDVANPDLVVTSDSETLTDLFYGDITPTEPYMNGILTLKGSEDDIVRLDFISLMIWGE